MNEFMFEDVTGRLRQAWGLTSETALADALGLASSAYFNRKKAGSLPHAEIARLAVQRGINLDWVLTGEGSMRQHKAGVPTKRTRPSFRT